MDIEGMQLWSSSCMVWVFIDQMILPLWRQELTIQNEIYCGLLGEMAEEEKKFQFLQENLKIVAGN